MSLTRTVGGFHEQFQNVDGVICHPLAEDKTLVLQEAVHAIQQPLGEVIPLDQHDRGIALTSHRD